MLEKVIYPQCACCGKVVKTATFGLCGDCFNSLVFNRFENRCKYCSYPLNTGSNICGRCFKEQRKFDGGIFLFPYNECGRTLIHNIKFKDKIEFLKVIEYYTDEIKEFITSKEIELITYVPSSLYHYLSRGYTVPRKIAIHLSEKFSIPFKKIIFTSRPFKKLLSTSKGISERKKIVNTFFTVRSKECYGSLLVVDDVFTTGTTINHIASLIKREKISEKVFFLTIAMVLDR